MAISEVHLHDELSQNLARVTVETRYGRVIGGRAANGSAAFLEVPYALPPERFTDPIPLPSDFRYEEKEYISENSYAAQPRNDGQAGDTPFEDKVGLGRPSENPLFVNIVVPPSFPSRGNFPVKIYIHGGFLQFGSPHALTGQAQYVAAERSEVWVNIGYRLSVFGFLACDEPKLEGNYGFKDQWLALLWVKDNVAAFGGNPDNIQLTGLSAGAHSVHQLLHFVSRLPQGVKSPFHSAVLQSNAIITNPKTPTELRPQFHALCRALDLDARNPEIISLLRDRSKIPAATITHLIETDALGIEFGTFRGCLDGDWLVTTPDPMSWQRTGGFANALKEKGVRSIAVGDLTEEWYLYAIAHPFHSRDDIVPNLERYYPANVVKGMVSMFRTLPEDAGVEEVERLFGEIASAGQVHLPVRLLVRDLQASSFPVMRYQIRWTPEQVRPKGYVTHGTDRFLWALRVPRLQEDQITVARMWLDRFADEIKALEEAGKPLRGIKEVLALNEDKSIQWSNDPSWEEIMRLTKIIPGELQD